MKKINEFLKKHEYLIISIFSLFLIPIYFRTFPIFGLPSELGIGIPLAFVAGLNFDYICSLFGCEPND